MSINIEYIPSEKMNFVYQPKTVDIQSELHPMARRFDTVGPPTTQTQQAESFMFNQGKDYMNLRILKTDRFQVTLQDNTVNPTSVATGSTTAQATVTHPALINRYNFWLDSICLSKQINGLKIQCGDLMLESDQNERNPWLLEVKSSQFDLEQCERDGHVPLYLDNLGQFSDFISKGAISQAATATFTNPSVITPLKIENFARYTKSAKITEVIRRRWRILDNTDGAGLAPVFTDVTGTVSGLTSTNTYDYFSGDWIPLNGSSVFYGNVKGVYNIEVQEYLVDKYLTTPYQKEKEAKCIKISPQSYATISFQYDTNYINNALFKWNPNSNVNIKFSGEIFSGTPAVSGNTHSISVQRLPAFSTIQLESFDVMVPPPNGFDFKILTWNPRRIEALAQTIGPKASTSDIIINDGNDNILPKYMLISYVPELWTGNQNAALITSKVGPENLSNYNPADIIKCEIQIGQQTVTQNIPISELKQMTIDLINNPELSNYINAKKMLKFVDPNRTFEVSTGCPFLLLDLEKLSLQVSKDCAQQMANVTYPTLQQIRITLQLKNTNWVGGDSQYGYVPMAFNYTAHIYKFYPYLTHQVEGGRFTTPIQLAMSYQDSIVQLTKNLETNPYINISMIEGGGWFSDAKDKVASFLRDNGQELLRSLMRGVRVGEQLTRGSSHPTMSHVNSGLNVLSDLGHNFGYGKKRSSSRSSSKGKRHGAVKRLR